MEFESAVIYNHISLPGRVSIEPGLVVCQFGFLGGRARLLQRQPEILVIHARLLPWPVRTTFELRDEAGDRAYMTPYLRIRATRAELAAAGFALRDVQAWIFFGGVLSGRYRPWRLGRFRRSE